MLCFIQLLVYFKGACSERLQFMIKFHHTIETVCVAFIKQVDYQKGRIMIYTKWPKLINSLEVFLGKRENCLN
jgi:hypothetical protein